MVSRAYFTLKNEEEKEDNLKVILNNISFNSLYKPKSYKEAINSLQKELWIKAMNIEFNTLKNNNTWELVKKSVNIKSIKTRWVYKIKYNNS